MSTSVSLCLPTCSSEICVLTTAASCDKHLNHAEFLLGVGIYILCAHHHASHSDRTFSSHLIRHSPCHMCHQSTTQCFVRPTSPYKVQNHHLILLLRGVLQAAGWAPLGVKQLKQTATGCVF